MNARARVKAADRGVGNVEIVTADIADVDMPSGSVALVAAVHALYAFPDPPAVIQRMYDWLRPGGVVWAVDPSGPLNIAGWRRYLFASVRREHGLATALQLLWRAREAARQNRRIDRALDSGAYWGKDEHALRAAFEAAGFTVVACEPTYRGCSHRLVARKPGPDGT